MSAERRNLPAVVEAAAPVKSAALIARSPAGHDRRRRRSCSPSIPGILRRPDPQQEYAHGLLPGRMPLLCLGRAASHWRARRHRANYVATYIYLAAYIEALQDTAAKPTVKQHLAAIRMLFDWLIIGQAAPPSAKPALLLTSQ